MTLTIVHVDAGAGTIHARDPTLLQERMNPTPRGFEIDVLLAHREWVARTARALVHGDAEAGDLEQDAWLRILERPPAASPRSPRAWLATVLRFTAVDRARAAGTRRRHEEGAARPESIPADTEEVVSRAELAEVVARTVLELEEPFRTTVLLRYFEGLAPRDIAPRMRVPVETVRTRLHRALAQIRERIDAGHGGDRQAWCIALLPVLREPTASVSASGGLAASGSVFGGVVMTQKTVALTAISLVLAGGLSGWAVARAGKRDSAALAADLARLQVLSDEQETRLARIQKAAGTGVDIAALRAASEDRAARLDALEKAAQGETGGTRSALDEQAARLSRLEATVAVLEKKSAPVDPVRRTREVLETLKAIEDPKRQVALRDSLEELVRMGDSAVPGIVAVLDSEFDRQYYGRPVTVSGQIPNAIHYSSLRQVLLDALREMATPLATERLFQAAGRSKSLNDLRDVLVLHSGSADPVAAKGIASLLPDMLRRLGESEPDDVVAVDLGRWLARWLGEHAKECSPAQLEDAIATARYGRDGWSGWAPELFLLLVQAEPERAASAVLALRERFPGIPADRQAMVALKFGRGDWAVPLARWADYFGALFSKGNLDDVQRKVVYASVPAAPCSAIKDLAKRAEDKGVLAAFLEGRLGVETDAEIRTTIEWHIRNLGGATPR